MFLHLSLGLFVEFVDDLFPEAPSLFGAFSAGEEDCDLEDSFVLFSEFLSGFGEDGPGGCEGEACVDEGFGEACPGFGFSVGEHDGEGSVLS